jgi:UDP-N-acetyl-2-amino-2-deoxyglucuronate dehydrogenase
MEDVPLVRNFAMTGVAGFVAPRHLRAIRDTGHRLVAAVDPHDSVGVLDDCFPAAAYFTEFERFDRHLEKLRRGPECDRVHVVSICSPNHLHDAHIRLALRIGADALCEKPVVINPWNLDALRALERETGARVYTVLQLRLHPALAALREEVRSEPGTRHRVVLTYIAPRGAWYRYSWKGDPERSGGLVMNIGVHLLDLLIWLFGAARRTAVHRAEPEAWAGIVELERADAAWYISTAACDLPPAAGGEVRTGYRSIVVDGREVEFSAVPADLHSRLYERTLAGSGFGLDEAAPAIELGYALRTAPVSAPAGDAHPYVMAPARKVLG